MTLHQEQDPPESSPVGKRPVRKAYSYIRFSTPEQALGNSMKRQISAAREFAEKELRMPFDDSFADKGISGYKLRNLEHGALGLFRDKIRSGEIVPGSVLIVENLNRLTRAEPLDAFDLLREIIKAGIEVITLHDRQRYSRSSMREIGPLIHALVLMHGSFKESENKSTWLSKAWADKRMAAEQGRPLTRQVPAWLNVTGVRPSGTRWIWRDAKFEVIKDRAEIVRQIFEHHANGWGRRKIAGWLNDNEVPVWGRGLRRAKGGWQESYIAKLLGNRAVLGEYQPHKLRDGRYSPRVPVGRPLKDYFPRIISDDLWHAAHAHDHLRRVIKGRPSTSILTSLVVGPDGAPMHAERKGQGCDYLATARAFRRKGNPVFRWRLDHLEKCVLMLVQGINWQRVLADDSQEPVLRALRAKLAAIDGEERQLKQQIDIAVKALLADLGVMGPSVKVEAERLTEVARKLSQAKAEIERQLAELEGVARVAQSGLIAVKTGDLTDPKIRIRLKHELRTILSKIQVYPDGVVPTVDEKLTKRIIDEAESWLTGNRGISAKLNRRVSGAVVLHLVTGKKFIAWVSYRPAARTDRDPELIAIQMDGWEASDMAKLFTHLGRQHRKESGWAKLAAGTAKVIIEDERKSAE